MASSRAGQFLAAAAALLAALVALTAVPRAAAQVYTINSNLTIEVVAGQKMSFAEARAYCASRGGQLATIGSLEEQQLIYSKLENKLVQHYW